MNHGREPIPADAAADGYATIADLYDHVVPYRDRADVAFWVEAARAADGPVLELGCGTGRVLIPVARAGVEVVGLDSSAHMLDVCRAWLEREAPEVRARVELVRADMRAFTLDRCFALAILPFRPFQHLVTVEDQVSCLTAIRDHLLERGRVILDVFNPSLEALLRPAGEELGGEPEFTMPDGRRVERRHRIVSRDLAAQVNEVELIYYVTHPDGREERLVHAFPMRYLFRFELEHLLVRCGFQVERVLADFAGSPYGSRDPGELIFIARKDKRTMAP